MKKKTDFYGRKKRRENNYSPAEISSKLLNE